MANKVLFPRRASSSGSSVSLSEILEDLEREEEEDNLKMGQAQTAISDGSSSDINFINKNIGESKETGDTETSAEFVRFDNGSENGIVVESNTNKEVIVEGTEKFLSDQFINCEKNSDLNFEEDIFFEAEQKNNKDKNQDLENLSSSSDEQNNVNYSEHFFETREESSDSGESHDYDLQDKEFASIEENLNENQQELKQSDSQELHTDTTSRDLEEKTCATPEEALIITEHEERLVFEVKGVTTDETSDEVSVENIRELKPENCSHQVENVTVEKTSDYFEDRFIKSQTQNSPTADRKNEVNFDKTSDYFEEIKPETENLSPSEISFHEKDVTVEEISDDLKELIISRTETFILSAKPFKVKDVMVDKTSDEIQESSPKNDEFMSSDDEIITTTKDLKRLSSFEIINLGRSISSENNDQNNSSKICSTINQLLVLDSREAEARLLAKRAARAEAREIRMRDLERQQRESEESADRQFDMLAEPVIRRPGSTSRFLSSRRSSEDSLEDTGSLRDLRHELKEVEEKFRKAMIANAQLDNDKAAQTYQLDFLKDRLEELEQEHSQLKRENRDKCRDFEQLKRLTAKLKEDLGILKTELEDRDRLIAEKGLVIVGEEENITEETSDGLVNGTTRIRRALVSAENAHLLETAGGGSLDVRLGRFAKERGELEDQISHLKLELEEEKNKRRKHSGSTLNGPNYDSDYDAADIQREASKQLAEFKFRAQKAEQDVATLQATVARLESQVIRYKTAAEISEKSEEALKSEKRKIQREAREAQSRAEELETTNTHLIKRLDKLKNAKSALLKEL